jgi:hypothetical protein
LPDEQSLPLPQGLPEGQLGAHAGAWQRPLVHAWEPQSPFAPQRDPSVQVGAQIGG